MKFINPMEGRAAPLEVTRLFQLDPQSIYKLFYGSIRSAIKAEGHESLFKTLDSVAAGKREPSEKFKSTMESLLGERFPLFVKGMGGDLDAMEAVIAMGPWELFCTGLKVDNDPFSYQVEFMIALERECYAPYKLITQDQHSQATALLQESTYARLFLWPQAIERMHGFQTKNEWPPYLSSMALETGLSFLAGWDAKQCSKLGLRQSIVKDVLPTSATNQNSITLLFKWVCSQAGVKGPTGLLKKVEAVFQDDSFTKRWSGGRHIPTYENYELVCNRISIPIEHDDEAVLRYAGAKILNFLGYYANCLMKIIESEELEAWGPWPLLPFECRTIQEWFEVRYPWWFEYHMQQLSSHDDH